MIVKINLVFVKDEGEEPESAWIMDAWDEFSIENNPEGYQESLDKLRDSYGYNNVHVLVVQIPFENVTKMFKPQVNTSDCKVVGEADDQLWDNLHNSMR